MQLGKYVLFLHLYSQREKKRLHYMRATLQISRLRKKKEKIECIPSMALCSSL